VQSSAGEETCREPDVELEEEADDEEVEEEVAGLEVEDN
jgi:hypothetical protein